MVDRNFSQFKSVVSGVPQGIFLVPLLSILYTIDMWNDLKSKCVSYADETTSYAEVACINVVNS